MRNFFTERTFEADFFSLNVDIILTENSQSFVTNPLISLNIYPKYLKSHQSTQQMRHLNDKLNLKLSPITQCRHPSTELLEDCITKVYFPSIFMIMNLDDIS